MDVSAVGDRDAGALLAAMLESEQTEEGDTGDLFTGGEDAKDPTLLFGVVAFPIVFASFVGAR
jgi:hypothetical protein